MKIQLSETRRTSKETERIVINDKITIMDFNYMNSDRENKKCLLLRGQEFQKLNFNTSNYEIKIYL